MSANIKALIDKFQAAEEVELYTDHTCSSLSLEEIETVMTALAKMEVMPASPSD